MRIAPSDDVTSLFYGVPLTALRQRGEINQTKMIIFAICYFTILFSFTLGGKSYNGLTLRKSNAVMEASIERIHIITARKQSFACVKNSVHRGVPGQIPPRNQAPPHWEQKSPRE